ncbi:uncharacterized protein LOC120845213 isoform X2 [Ixodes scapularis]|uniref:uncharacterized protein LOC120845213 isoform X2 n=1 Tax=Ixodes scapularis TaxID=6945 RepID=UPI001A9EA047|nr:uncharacterized protein LOC120845213 isoform X2 [Ixodes scapularis]
MLLKISRHRMDASESRKTEDPCQKPAAPEKEKEREKLRALPLCEEGKSSEAGILVPAGQRNGAFVTVRLFAVGISLITDPGLLPSPIKRQYVTPVTYRQFGNLVP